MGVYIANYPVEIGYKDNGDEMETLPKGTAFTVESIGQIGLKLKPLKKQDKKIEFVLDYSGEVLATGFTKVDEI